MPSPFLRFMNKCTIWASIIVLDLIRFSRLSLSLLLSHCIIKKMIVEMRRSHFSPRDCCSCSSHYDHHHSHHYFWLLQSERGGRIAKNEWSTKNQENLSIHPSIRTRHSLPLITSNQHKHTKKELLLSHRWAIETHTRLTYFVKMKHNHSPRNILPNGSQGSNVSFPLS